MRVIIRAQKYLKKGAGNRNQFFFSLFQKIGWVMGNETLSWYGHIVDGTVTNDCSLYNNSIVETIGESRKIVYLF